MEIMFDMFFSLAIGKFVNKFHGLINNIQKV